MDIRGHAVTEQKLGVRECARPEKIPLLTNRLGSPHERRGLHGDMTNHPTKHMSIAKPVCLQVGAAEVDLHQSECGIVCSTFFAGVPSRVLSAGSAFAKTASSTFRCERHVLTMLLNEISCALHICLPYQGQMPPSTMHRDDTERTAASTFEKKAQGRQPATLRLRFSDFRHGWAVTYGLSSLSVYDCLHLRRSQNDFVEEREREKRERERERTHHSPSTGTDDTRHDWTDQPTFVAGLSGVTIPA